MTLFILSTNKDLSLELLTTSAKKLGVHHKVLYYSDLSLRSGVIYHQDQKLNINSEDKLLIRWPWDAKNPAKDYNFWVKIFLLRYEKNISLDKKALANFSPFYEDKLFQAEIFSLLKVPSPKTTYFQTRKQLEDNPVDFPAVLKKRISSRSKGNFIVDSVQNILANAKPRIRKYILQSKIEFTHDVRVIFLKGKYIGSVSRKIFLRKQNRMTVKMDKVFEVSEEVVQQSKQISNYLGGDFLGIDVLIDKKGKYYFLEANLSPQFNKFKEISGINLGELVIQAALE